MNNKSHMGCRHRDLLEAWLPAQCPATPPCPHPHLDPVGRAIHIDQRLVCSVIQELVHNVLQAHITMLSTVCNQAEDVPLLADQPATCTAVMTRGQHFEVVHIYSRMAVGGSLQICQESK
jgi:hypothetical protein